MFRKWPLVTFLVLSPCAVAHGAYTLTPLVGGLNKVDVMPGDSFDLDIVLTSDAADDHLSSEFRVLFSDPGIQYNSYQWGNGYTNGGIDDVSVPSLGDLTTTIQSNSYNPTADIDVYFSNLTDDGAMFGEGVLVTLSLTVPADWVPGPDSITISLEPELFFDGFEAIPTVASSTFMLNIPSPGGISAFAVFFSKIGTARRRRRLIAA